MTFGAQAVKVQPVALNGARLARALRGDAALWVLAPLLAKARAWAERGPADSQFRRGGRLFCPRLTNAVVILIVEYDERF